MRGPTVISLPGGCHNRADEVMINGLNFEMEALVREALLLACAPVAEFYVTL